jgi:hypothetical protein
LKRINNYIALGLLFNGINLFSTRFGLLPDIVEGICVGLGVTFIFIGMLSTKYDISKLRSQKRIFLKNTFGK